MTQQRDDAAERSAHVTRGAAAPGEMISPVVETPEGYRLRAVVDAERTADLERQWANFWRNMAGETGAMAKTMRADRDAHERRATLLAAKLGELEDERNAWRARAEAAEAALRETQAELESWRDAAQYDVPG